jgi:sodium-dependent phosphate cotransporter
VVALIYLFLVGVSSLETGIKIMGEDTQERLFSAASNPLAALCIGILGTVLVQSSSASTSVIVGLVASVRSASTTPFRWSWAPTSALL